MQKPNDYREQMGLVQRSMNEYEWTKELDSFLMQTVIRNYFNFQIVSIEVNNEAKTLGLDFGATNVFDGDKCRIRWTYLHLQRKLGQPLVYPNLQPRLYSSASENESDTNKENINENSRQIPSSLSTKKSSKKGPRIISKKDPMQLLQEKDFQISQKKAPKTMEEIEANMWKNNIKPGMRKRNDFLDTSAEDFSMNKTRTIDGKEITPSSFNIFRDSLREASERLHETLNENLPDMNLKEIEESESEAEMSGSDDEDVLPLDFRTALIEKDNKVVIQAKPLTMRTITDFENEDVLAASMRKGGRASGPGLDTYLEMVRKEAFKEEEGAIMLDPDINIKEKFDLIDLKCNTENRINNAINAPVRTEYIGQISSSSNQDSAASKRRGPRMKTTKTYDTDTDNQLSEEEKFVSKKRAQKADDGISKSLKQAQQSETFKADPLSFENSLKESGIDNLDDIISGKATAAKGPSQLSQIIKDNEAYQKKMAEEDAAKGFNVMDDLDDIAGPPVEETAPSKAIDSDPHHTEESDTAPVSPYADALTAEQEAKQKEEERKKQFLKAVQIVSSASETDEMSGTESAKARKRIAKLEGQQSASGLSPVKESSSLSAKKKRKVKYYKGQMVMSDTEDDPKKIKQPQQEGEEAKAEESSSSRSSHGSADDFFNQQRKAIRKKLNIPAKTGIVTSSPELPKNNDKEESEEEDEEDIAYQKRIEAERKLQQEMIKKKKEERMNQADELRRQEKLKKQQEMIDAEQAKKRKEKDELMNKLKKQDEERKKRKRIEKEQQERERKRHQDMIAERKRDEEDRKKEEEDKKKQLVEEEQRKQRQVLDEQRRKDDFEETLLSEESWNENGRTSISCLYDKKCAYMGRPNSIPLDLEHQIQNEQIPKEDLVFGRYKTMMIPLDSHINNETLSDLIKYFLLNSKIHQTHKNDFEEAEAMKNCFPYKLIGMQVTVTEAPLSKPPLRPYINTVEKMQNASTQMKLEQGAIRVLSLLFDTQDEPKVVGNFREILKTIKLSNILQHSDISFMETNYMNFMHKLAKKYFRAHQVKEFPFALATASNHLIEFENPSDVQFLTSSANLGQIAFYTEYMRQDDVTPPSTEESWEFFRRCPSFYAFNPNKLGHTKWDSTKKKSHSKVVSKKVQHQFENVCVVLKDINYVPVVACKAESSLAYLLTKACHKHGLDICGLRLVYVDDKQHEEYYQLFHEKIELSSTWEKPMLALVFRGLDAAQKMEEILGHFNPEMARRTDEKSLRACFGKSKQDNCAMQIFDAAKRQLSLKFWFGGRVQGEKFVINNAGIMPAKKENVIQLIAPTNVAKHLMFLSPNLPAHKIPVVLQRLSNMGVSVLDLQMIDFSKLQYHAHTISQFSREGFNNIRGRTFKFQVGYVIKISRENLKSHFLSSRKYWERDLDGALDEHSLDQLFFLTNTNDEYEKLNHILKKDCLKTRYADLNSIENEEEKQKYKQVRKSLNYDSEDPEEYKDIDLFSGLQPSKPMGGKTARKTNIKPIKSKIVDPVALEQKYQIGTCVCFIKISSFKKQVIGSTLHAILNQLDVELLGLRVMKGKKELYNENVPKEVQKIVKCIAYKFHESSSEIKLRKKLLEFKTLALVLRGQDIQGQLSKIYDLEKLRFKSDHSEGLEDMSFEDNPHVVFLTNKATIAPIIDFMMETKYLNLFYDIKNRASHLSNSLTHFERLNKMIEQKDSGDVIDATSVIKIESQSDLLEPGELSEAKSCKAVCVVKPNQPFNVVLRALRSFANINPEGTKKKDYLPFVSISNLEIVQNYSQEQINHLYKHEFEFDESLSSRQKQKFKYTHDELFQGRPVIQMVLSGHNALTKLKGLIGNQQYGGPSSSKLDVKDTLRSFYAIDRVDNAFYNSDTVEESEIDEKVLFNTENQMHKSEQWQIVAKDGKPQGGKVDTGAPVNLILQQNQVELALVVISPTLVSNNDFVYVVDDFNRSKFAISALKMKSLGRESLEALFKDQCPRNHNLDVLESEFKRGDALLMVVEKVKAVEEAQNLVGKFGIKINSDWEKKKTHKKQGFQFMSYGGGAANERYEETTLIHEYGSYIFCFPNVDLNKVKIANEFRTLPASQNFKIERVK